MKGLVTLPQGDREPLVVKESWKTPIELGMSTHTHTHTVLMAIFPGESELASCPLNSPSPFIPGLRILWGQT